MVPIRVARIIQVFLRINAPANRAEDIPCGLTVNARQDKESIVRRRPEINSVIGMITVRSSKVEENPGWVDG